MKLGIIHLSDCHVEHGNEPFLKRVDQIVLATRNFFTPPRAWLLVFSGDLSDHGTENQIKHGALFLDTLVSRLREQHGSTPFIIKVPGNHDCYIPDESARINLTDSVRKGDFATAKELILAAQNPFWESCPYPATHSFNNKLVFLDVFHLGTKRVAIIGVNSSWMSDKHEAKGKIEFDPAWLKPVEDWVYQNNPDVVITVTHHPLHWEGEQVHRELWSCLERTTDLLFTGHEHTDGTFVRNTQEAAITVIEGGLLHKKNTPLSTFNVVNIDLKTPRIIRHSCTWNVQGGVYVAQPQFDQQFSHNTKRDRLSLLPTWVIEMETSSLKFCHPRKSPVDLSSYYIWPNLSVVSRKKTTESRICGKKVAIEWLLEHKRMRIVGGVKTGKTAFLKMLFRDLHEMGYIPVFLDLAQTDGNIDVHISRAITEQYKNLKWPEVAGNPKLVILADNFDQCRPKLSKRLEILSSLANGTSYCVLSTNNREDLEYLGSGAVSEIWDSFRVLQLETFTHTQRSDLLFSWAKINAPLDQEDNQLEREVEQGNDQISSILGDNLVPSTPLIVVMLWREIQAGNTPSNIGAQGYLYDHLIKYMFEKSTIKQRDLGFDVRYNFLSHLAYDLFNSGEVLSPESLETVMARFVAETELEPNLQRLVEDCIFLGILKEKDGGFCFGLEYIHYYFTAYFIWQHKHQSPEVAQVLERITDNLYEQANAQITIFYTYLSTDDVTMRKVLNLAQQCLKNGIEFSYDSLKPAQIAVSREVKKIVNLSSRITVLDGKPALEVAISHPQPAQETALKEIVLARRLSLVLGQIVRNFPVTLANRLGVESRDAFVREGYRLELVALSKVVEYLEAHAGEVIQHMESVLTQEGFPFSELASDRREILESAANILLRCIITQVVMDVPHTLCSKDILAVHKSIITNAGKDNPIYDVIDAAIQIDFRKSYPLAVVQQKAKALWHRDENAWETLRDVVYRSLLKYSRETSVIQSLCTTFKLEYKSQYLLNDKAK